jgi:hypothetical protein
VNGFAVEKSVKQLHAMLFQLRLGGLEPQDITQRVTDAVEGWARGQGWDVWREYDIPGYTRQDSEVGGRLDVYARCADGTGVAIEIDRFDREKSLDKLAFCAASGDRALWIRWRSGGAPSGLVAPSGVHTMEVDVSRASPFIGWGRTPPAPVGGDGNSARAYASWSTREERRLIALYQRDMSIEQIAQQLGRGSGAIRSRLRKLGWR